MVKIPMSIGSLAVTSSPSAENLLKFPGSHGDKKVVNYLHNIPVIFSTIHTSSVTSVVAPVCASSILAIHLSDDECQEIPYIFPGTNYGEKFQSKIKVKIPDDVTLTQHNVRFLEKPLVILMV